MPDDLPSVRLPCGRRVPALGQGTWHMGEDPARRRDELASLKRGLDLGLTLVDTAEMYGEGAAEELVGEAIADRRDEVFLVSKVLPSNAGHDDAISACEASLGRLRTDRLDLYLLHWRGETPLEETIGAFDALLRAGKIRSWGVSNLDTDELDQLTGIRGGAALQTDQVLYNLSRRGIEYDLVPWCRRRGIPVMAYSPVEQGRLLAHPVLRRVASRHRATAAQVALAWTLRDGGVIAIPKAGTPSHVEDNRAAGALQLTTEDRTELDRAFPPPASKQPLEML